MTKEAFYLLMISALLFSFFLIAIISSWFFQNFRDVKTKKLEDQLDELLYFYFHTENENKRTIVQKIVKIIGKRAGRKEMLINRLIRCGDDFIETHHAALMNLYEIVGIKAYVQKGLASNQVHMKSLACRYIGELQLENMEADMISLISSENNDVTYNVMLALAKLGDMKGLVHILTNDAEHMYLSHRAIIEIISAFKGSKEELFKRTIDLCDDYMKGILIKAIAEDKIEGLSPYYMSYLNSDDKNLRIASIRALCELNNEDDESYIRSKLDDKDWEVRAAAAKGLEKLGTSQSFAALGKTTGDSVWWVRHNAASALILIPGGKEFASRIINGDDKFAREAVTSLIEKNN